MYCYRDKTFCAYSECTDKECTRRLTDKVLKEAEECNSPICQFVEKPDCFQEEMNNEK